jgi:hypothetical protein
MNNASNQKEGRKNRLLELIVTVFIGLVMIAIFIKIVFD